MAEEVQYKCSDCQVWKDPEEFHKNSRDKRGLTYSCKVCANLRSKNWYKKRENLDKRNQRVNEKQIERKKWAIDYMGGKCQDCGNVYHPCCYDFHHLDPSQKENNPSYFIKLSKEKAMDELQKCVLLCSNCHRMRHFV